MSKILQTYDTYYPLGNVVVSLALKADEVFFVYHDTENEKDIRNVQKVLERKNVKVNLIHLQNDEEEIENIISNNPDIIIDMSAVRYLSLFLFEKALKHNLRVVYFDDERYCIKDYRTHSMITDKLYHLSIEDIVNLKGGKIVSSMHDPIKDEETVKAVSETVEENLDHYTAFIHAIQKLNSIITNSKKIGSLSYALSDDNARYVRNNSQNFYRLLDLENTVLTFKNSHFKKLTEISGSFLEQYLYNKLISSNLFDDVKMSAVVDFSGGSYETVRCEIDCLLVSNNKLLFISCKSTKASTEALNEIYVHNSMFGNVISEPVLVIVEDMSRLSPSIYAKGKEMGVKIIDNTDFVNDNVTEKINDIIHNRYEYEED
ncbi:MAG: DUF1887 family CARF protein [Erysipelotrichaceae bacterium]|nr:DUF1887 family CARF protein [Erysipelotrichaceae bacterium]